MEEFIPRGHFPQIVMTFAEWGGIFGIYDHDHWRLLKNSKKLCNPPASEASRGVY